MKVLGVILSWAATAIFPLVTLPAIAQQEAGVLIGTWERVAEAVGEPPMTLVVRELAGIGITGTLQTRRGDLPLNAENSEVALESGIIRLEFRTIWANYDLWYGRGELSGKELVLFGQLMNQKFDVRFEKKAKE